MHDFGQENDESCAYCRDSKGGLITKAKNIVERAYKIDGHPFMFCFRLCELCEYARRIFPTWDAMTQAALIKIVIARVRDRYV